MTRTKPLQNLSQFFKPISGVSPLGAPAAFAAVYERAHISVFRYIYGLRGGPQEEVEDLAAETFARAWKARHTFDGDEAAALGWLLKIARRLVIDAYRRQKAANPADELPADLPSLDAPLEEGLVADEQRQILWTLLQALPDKPREMLVLRYLLGWRVNQIAEYLSVPENTVSVAIRRALARLQNQWPAPEES